MTLITAEELARGLIVGVFGGAAGVATLAFPGSPLWLVPAAAAVGGCALTVPEIRQEAARAVPQLLAATRNALATVQQVEHWRKTGRWERPALAAPQQPASPGAHRRGQAPPWLHTLNNEPDRAPHTIVFGPTGAGKTTFTRAIVGARGEPAVVLSPKLTAGNWSGAEVVTLDDDGTYAPIAAALGELEREKRRRIGVLRRDGAEALEPLTIVLDEVPELTANVKDAGPFLVSMAGIGRELRMRLVCLSTSERVGALGIKGRGDTLANFVRVDLDRDRRGTLNDGVSITPIEQPATWGRLAERAELRPWREPAEAEVVKPAIVTPSAVATGETIAMPLDLSDFLNELLAQPVTSASGSPGNASGVTVTVPTATGNGNGNGAASASVTSASGSHGNAIVKVYAHAVADGRAPARKRRGLDVRARRARAQEQRQSAELHRAYAEARAAGVPSFRQAYAQLGGNREQALAAWQAAEQKEGTR